MSKMIERVARAIATSAGARMAGPGQSVATREFGWKGDGEHLELYVERHWKEHEHAATFAIEAMREPTSEMWDACSRAKADFEAGIAWGVMVDAALDKVDA